MKNYVFTNNRINLVVSLIILYIFIPNNIIDNLLSINELFNYILYKLLIILICNFRFFALYLK